MARGKKKKTAEKSAPGKEKNTPQQTEGGSPGGTDSELQEHVNLFRPLKRLILIKLNPQSANSKAVAELQPAPLL